MRRGHCRSSPRCISDRTRASSLPPGLSRLPRAHGGTQVPCRNFHGVELSPPGPRARRDADGNPTDLYGDGHPSPSINPSPNAGRPRRFPPAKPLRRRRTHLATPLQRRCIPLATPLQRRCTPLATWGDCREPAHGGNRCRAAFDGASADPAAHDGGAAKPVGIIHTFIAGRAEEDRRPMRTGQRVPMIVLADASIDRQSGRQVAIR